MTELLKNKAEANAHRGTKIGKHGRMGVEGSATLKQSHSGNNRPHTKGEFGKLQPKPATAHFVILYFSLKKKNQKNISGWENYMKLIFQVHNALLLEHSTLFSCCLWLPLHCSNLAE